MYERELRLLRRTLEKCRLQVLELDLSGGGWADLGLRHMLGMEEDHNRLVQESFRIVEERVICRVTDAFRCAYILLRLPGRDSVLAVGPYLPEPVEGEWIMERAERLGVPPHRTFLLERYYQQLPVFPEQSFLLACVNAFAETLWGGEDAYRMVDINQQLHHSALTAAGELPEDLDWNIRVVEERYAFENELMQAVSQGLGHKAELMLAHFPTAAMERRQADPVREMRNYCIIINTLLRKAAERGGAHPLHLDDLSSAYARRIELVAHVPESRSLMVDMFRDYCRLVSRHSVGAYSQVVQRVLLYIDADLAGDLTLSALARRQNVNASYLSALFRRETGRTLTEYVNRRRVEQALRLLGGTKLQIQTVAQHCGLPDVNYFSRVFKRYTGLTPREYRAGTMPVGDGRG